MLSSNPAAATRALPRAAPCPQAARLTGSDDRTQTEKHEGADTSIDLFIWMRHATIPTPKESGARAGECGHRRRSRLGIIAAGEREQNGHSRASRKLRGLQAPSAHRPRGRSGQVTQARKQRSVGRVRPRTSGQVKSATPGAGWASETRCRLARAAPARRVLSPRDWVNLGGVGGCKRPRTLRAARSVSQVGKTRTTTKTTTAAASHTCRALNARRMR